MRYTEAMNFDDDKPEMVKSEKGKKKEERVLAGSKDYDYYNLSSSKKILTNNGRV